jgi:hypothetical protein
MGTSTAATPAPELGQGASPTSMVSRPVTLADDLPRWKQAFYRLSVHQYDRMVASGILTENDRAELLEGILIAKMSKNPAI